MHDLKAMASQNPYEGQGTQGGHGKKFNFFLDEVWL